MKTADKVAHAREAERGSPHATGMLLEELANPTVGLQLKEFTVATVPAAADYRGVLIFVNNGGGGDPVTAVSDGTNWKRSDTGGNIADA